ncbi:MAG: 4Fe-4S dicluster domain-containing protein [Candidatus Eisenbacteria bacterium]|nr:4Fe-4S dicluster domain-containing protein [Candidatus Eisenbacteria bacterium]
MPWVNGEMCTGCELCVDECPAGAISVEQEVAHIDDTLCIRCGVCHDVCPNEAVRHDGERIPEEVESNVAWVRRMLSNDYYSGDTEKRGALMERVERYFRKDIKVAEKTIERLRAMAGD